MLTRTLGPFCNFSRNTAVVFLGLLHYTIVLVLASSTEICINRLNHFLVFLALNVSIDVVDVGIVVLDPHFRHVDLDNLNDLDDEKDLFLSHFFLSFSFFCVTCVGSSQLRGTVERLAFLVWLELHSIYKT